MHAIKASRKTSLDPVGEKNERLHSAFGLAEFGGKYSFVCWNWIELLRRSINAADSTVKAFSLYIRQAEMHLEKNAEKKIVWLIPTMLVKVGLYVSYSRETVSTGFLLFIIP